MADWYVSSSVYAGITKWTASTAVTVGTIWRPNSPAVGAEYAFRCTTAGTTGTTEPTWPTANNATVTDGGAVWTNVSGQAAYGWSAAAGTLKAINGSGAGVGRFVAGDRAFASSDHSETSTAGNLSAYAVASGTTPTQLLSVNRTSGNIPPLESDKLAGASFSATTGSVIIDGAQRVEGCTLSAGADIWLQNINTAVAYLKNCKLILTSTSASSYIGTNNPGQYVLDNTTAQFGAAGQSFRMGNSAFKGEWLNTPNAIQGAVLPTTLIVGATGGAMTLRGVDLSALGTGHTLVDLTGSASPGSSTLLVGCKLGSGVAIASGSGASNGSTGTVDLINCDSGNTNYRCERYSEWGAVTTETAIVLTGGVTDGTTAVSRKLASDTFANFLVGGLEGFAMDVWNDTTGVAKTATVEIISSVTLTNKDVVLDVEYLGDAASPQASIATTFPGTLATASNLNTSTASWAAQPATPVKQNLSLSFTPQQKGWVRGVLRVCKPSTTVYYNPAMALV